MYEQTTSVYHGIPVTEELKRLCFKMGMILIREKIKGLAWEGFGLGTKFRGFDG